MRKSVTDMDTDIRPPGPRRIRILADTGYWQIFGYRPVSGYPDPAGRHPDTGQHPDAHRYPDIGRYPDPGRYPDIGRYPAPGRGRDEGADTCPLIPQPLLDLI